MRRVLSLATLLVACQFGSGDGSGNGDLGESASSTGAEGPSGASTSASQGATTSSNPTSGPNPTTGGPTSGMPTTVDPDTGTTDGGSEGDPETSADPMTSSSGEPLELQIAEELLVALDATNGNASPTGWINTGSMDDFVALGSPTIETVGGVAATTLSSGNGYRSPQNAPATLVEPDATRTVEVWVLNPDAQDQESMVAWGRRNQGTGTLMVFGYGTQPDWGAVNHWGFPDLGWGGTPQQNVWHHLVYTFDGTTTRVYVDGELHAEEEVGAGAVDSVDGERIVIGAQTDDNGDLSRWATLSLARVRVHAGALSPGQVEINYLVELAELGL